MAAKRQQQEMDRVFKKIDELIADFDRLWEWMHDPKLISQRDKYETELKKELKKMQRLREQLKIWLGDKTIKIKTDLMEYRRKVEEKMEQYKNLEDKHKPFSNGGLLKVESDPDAKHREENEGWICECLDALRHKCEINEAEMERLRQGKKKQKDERIADIRSVIERHEGHILMLEKILRALRNGEVQVESVAGLKEGVELYMENHEDPDFIGDEELYVAIEEELDANNCNKNTLTNTEIDEEEETSGREGVIDKDIEGNTVDQPAKKEKTSSASKKKARSNRKEEKATKSEPKVPTFCEIAASSVVRAKAQPAQPVEFPLLPNSTEKISHGTGKEEKEYDPKQPLFSTVVKEPSRRESPRQFETLQASDSMRRLADSRGKVGKGLAELRPSANAKANLAVALAEASSGKEITAEGATADAENVQAAAVERELFPTSPPTQPTQKRLDFCEKAGTSHLVSPLMQVTSEREGWWSKFSRKQLVVLFELENGLYNHFPQSEDDPQESAFQRVLNDVKFPERAMPLSRHDGEKFFPGLNVEALFYIFYFQEGTERYARSIAELRRRGWMFHKTLQRWLRRYEEPRVKSEEFEVGSFAYFDCSSGSWCQRLKENFRLEYNQIQADFS